MRSRSRFFAIVLGILISAPTWAAEQQLLNVSGKNFETTILVFAQIDAGGQITGLRMKPPIGFSKRASLDTLRTGYSYKVPMSGLELFSLKSADFHGSTGGVVDIRYLHNREAKTEADKFRSFQARVLRNSQGNWIIESMDPKFKGEFNCVRLTGQWPPGSKSIFSMLGVENHELVAPGPASQTPVYDGASKPASDSAAKLADTSHTSAPAAK